MGADLGGPGVLAIETEVDVARVVGDLHERPLGGRGVVPRCHFILDLHGLSKAPARIVELAREPDVGVDSPGLDVQLDGIRRATGEGESMKKEKNAGRGKLR